MYVFSILLKWIQKKFDILTVKAARPRCDRPALGGETVTILENATLNDIVFTYEGSDWDDHVVAFTPRETISSFFFDRKSKNDEYFRVNDTLDFETKNQYVFKNV